MIEAIALYFKLKCDYQTLKTKLQEHIEEVKHNFWLHKEAVKEGYRNKRQQ